MRFSLAFAAQAALVLFVAILSTPVRSAEIFGAPGASKPFTDQRVVVEFGKKGLSFQMDCDQGNSCFPLTSGTIELTIGSDPAMSCVEGHVPGNGCSYLRVPFDSAHPRNTFRVYYADDFPSDTPITVTVANVIGSGGASGCMMAPCELSFIAGAPAAIPRVATNTELVLDTSGSMLMPSVNGTNATSNCSSSVTTQSPTRLCALQVATSRFLADYEEKAILIDKIGAVRFSSNASGIPALGHGIDAQHMAGLRQFVTGLNAGGATAIGEAMHFAKVNGLPGIPPNQSKWVMLFTDGEQNIQPNVSSNGQQVAVGGLAYGGNIRVCPITTGLQTAPGFALLQSIADAACGGENHVISAPTGAAYQAFLDTAFSQSLASIMQGDKYEISRDVTDTIRNQSFVDFPVNGNDVSFEVALSGSPAVERPRFTLISPDGTEVAVDPRVAPGTSIARVELPLIIDGRPIPHEGYWRVIIDRESFGKWPDYHLIVTNDNPAISASFKALGGDVGTGDPLIVQARILEDGKLIPDVKVTVDITGPAFGLGNVLSTTEVNGEFPGLEGDEPGGAGKRKLLSLASSPLAAKLLDNEFRETIDLTYCQGRGKLVLNHPFCTEMVWINPKVAPGGAYLGLYKDSALEGHYTFTFHAIGTTANSGDFERTWRTALFVRPKAYGPNSPVIVEAIKQLPDGSIAATLTVEPHDQLGNYIGPGYDDALEMINSFNSFPFASDNLDGSYTFEIQTYPKDTIVVLRALGDDIKSFDLASAGPGDKL